MQSGLLRARSCVCSVRSVLLQLHDFRHGLRCVCEQLPQGGRHVLFGWFLSNHATRLLMYALFTHVFVVLMRVLCVAHLCAACDHFGTSSCASCSSLGCDTCMTPSYTGNTNVVNNGQMD